MNKSSATITLAAALLLLNVGWGKDKGPQFPTRDAAKLSQAKTVALFSVYGPESAVDGAGESEQAYYDAVEQNVSAALAKQGLSVVPLDKSKSVIEGDYVDTYITFMPARDQKSAQLAKAGMGRGYLFAVKPAPIASSRTHVLYGSDAQWYNPKDHSNDHAAGDGDTFKQDPPKYPEPFFKTLAQLTPKAGADAYAVVRVVPTMAMTVATKASKWNPIGQITTGIHAIKAIKEGDHGFVTIDMAIYNGAGETLFADHVIGMSSEAVGAGSGFHVGRNPADVARLTKAALDDALPKLYAHLEGKSSE